jgi:hypothetical protein
MFSSICDFVTNRNHRSFRITLQLLQISRNIFYTHHCFEITVVIRPAARLRVIAVFVSYICLLINTWKEVK